MEKSKGGFKRELPSQHEDTRKKLEEMHQKDVEDLEREKARIAAAFDWFLKQENGRIVWAWLFNRCGYNKPVLMRMAGGDIAPLSTEAAAAQREVYRDLRKMILTPELLAAAEFEAEFGIVKTEPKGEKK